MTNKYDQGYSYLYPAILVTFTALQYYHPTDLNPLLFTQSDTPRSRKKKKIKK